MHSKLPNFFIVGAAKSGTTSIFAYLSQHPEIFFSPLKEPKFFSVSANTFPHKGPGDSEVDNTIIKDKHDYLNLFKGAKDEKVIGEASADYLYFYKIAAPLIYECNPNAKILIILRNPAERAFSAYRHMLKDKRESLSFENAIEAEESRMDNNYEFIWFYKDVGHYYHQVLEYLKTFNKGSVKICLFEDLTKNSSEVTREILKFLEVDECFSPDISEKHNVSEIKLNESLDQFLSRYNHPVKNLLRPLFLNTLGKDNTERLVNYFKGKNVLRMRSKTRKSLINLYRDDIIKLQDLIKRDLSSWL